MLPRQRHTGTLLIWSPIFQYWRGGRNRMPTFQKCLGISYGPSARRLWIFRQRSTSRRCITARNKPGSVCFDSLPARRPDFGADRAVVSHLYRISKSGAWENPAALRVYLRSEDWRNQRGWNPCIDLTKAVLKVVNRRGLGFQRNHSRSVGANSYLYAADFATVPSTFTIQTGRFRIGPAHSRLATFAPLLRVQFQHIGGISSSPMPSRMTVATMMCGAGQWLV